MDKTPNLGLHTISPEEVDTLRADEALLAVAGTGDARNMGIIDRAYGSLSQRLEEVAPQWRVYRGEYLDELVIYASDEPLPEDLSGFSPVPLSPTVAAVLSGGEQSGGFTSAQFNYGAGLPWSASYLTILADGGALTCRGISVEQDGAVAYEGVLPARADIHFDKMNETAELVVRLFPAGTSPGDADYDTNVKSYTLACARNNHAAPVDIEVISSVGEENPDNLELLWHGAGLIEGGAAGNGTPDPGSALYGYKAEAGDPNYSVLVDTLDTGLTLAVTVPSAYAIQLRQEGGTQQCEVLSGAVNAEATLGYVSNPTLGEVDAEGNCTLTATLRLNPSMARERFIVTVTDGAGLKGSYWITVHRAIGDKIPALQTFITGTVDTPHRTDKTATVTLYRKDDSHWNSATKRLDTFLDLLAGDPNVDADVTYRKKFQYATDPASGLLTQVWREVMAGGTNSYTIEPGSQNFTKPGTYMLVFSRPGYLDSVVDNIMVYETFGRAEYDFGETYMIAGDLNGDGLGDGVIDEQDRALFTEMSKNEKHASLLDFNGDGTLTFADESIIVSNFGMTADWNCSLDNMTSQWGAALVPKI